MRTFRLIPLLLLPALLLFARVARADVTHVVQPGETTWSISVQYGVSVEDIAEANNMENFRVVSVGQQLIIPGVSAPTPVPTASPAPPAKAPVTIPADAVETADGVLHPVQPGDTLFEIALLYGSTVTEVAEANDLDNIRAITIGRKLLIPGARLPRPATSAAAAPTPTPESEPVAAVAPAPEAAADLLPNSSFEGGWYFYLYNELQVPEGWKMTTDEGPNTLDPGSGGLFNRPEMRVVSKAQLPEFEWNDFVFDGFKTVKVFKGGAPTKFAMFTDQPLEPGRYRMTIRFFPDVVAQYSPGNGKTWSTLPRAAEARVIVNDGGTGWVEITPGQRGELSYEFTVGQRGVVRLGGEFRNRYQMANNGWFLDTWTLRRVGN